MKIYFIGILLNVIVTFQSFADQKELDLVVNAQPQAVTLNFKLENHQWRWLGKKKQIVFATWKSQEPPLNIVNNKEYYEGISAEFITLIGYYLGTKISVLQYNNYAQALESVKTGKSDILIDDSNNSIMNDDNYYVTKNYFNDFSSLISCKDTQKKYNAQDTIKISAPINHLSDEEIKKLYPNAIISRFPSHISALTALMWEDQDFVIGRFSNLSYLIEEGFIHSLKVSATYENLSSGARFIVKKKNIELYKILETLLKSLSDDKKKSIVSAWYNRKIFFDKTQDIKFTKQERNWLKKNNYLKVGINPLYAPLTFVDEEGKMQGILFDILDLISVRTGLTFNVSEIHEDADAIENIARKKLDIISVKQNSNNNVKELETTRPYHSSLVVLVTRKNTPSIYHKEKIKISFVSSTTFNIKKIYPNKHVEALEVNNPILALRMLERGNVDAAVVNFSSANYAIKNFFPESLHIVKSVGEEMDKFTFVINKENRELESILNKALASISPQEQAKIKNKWRKVTVESVKTWKVYNTFHKIIFLIFTFTVLAIIYPVIMMKRLILIKNKERDDLIITTHLLNAVINHYPTVYYIINNEGFIIFKNINFLSFFDKSIHESLLFSLFDNRHPLTSLYKHYLQEHKSSNYKTAKTNKFNVFDGHSIKTILHHSSAYIGPNGDLEGVICSWIEITDDQKTSTPVSANDEKNNDGAALEINPLIPLGKVRCLNESITPSNLNNNPQKTNPAVSFKHDIEDELSYLINFSGIKKIMFNDEDLLLNILMKTCNENRSDLARAQNAFIKREWDDFSIALHKLCGASQVIGAEHIEELISSIENQLLYKALIEDIEIDLKRLEKEIITLECLIYSWARSLKQVL